MKTRTIQITEADKKRLVELMRVAAEFGGQSRKDLGLLEGELARAEIVSPKRKFQPAW